MPRSRRPPLAAEAAQRNREQVARLGAELRASRRRRDWTQAELGGRVGLSQSTISAAERGLGGSLSIDAWQRLFLAVGRRLAIDAGRDPAEEPVDAAHLAMQELVLRTLRGAGIRATVELPTRPADPRRSADVAARDDRHRRLLIVECWNTFGDIGAAARSTSRKLADATGLAAAIWGEDPHSIHGVWVVRATARNRALVARYPEVFASRCPGSSVAWIRALREGTSPPGEVGLAWCDVPMSRLFAWRRR